MNTSPLKLAFACACLLALTACAQATPTPPPTSAPKPSATATVVVKATVKATVTSVSLTATAHGTSTAQFEFTQEPTQELKATWNIGVVQPQAWPQDIWVAEWQDSKTLKVLGQEDYIVEAETGSVATLAPFVYPTSPPVDLLYSYDREYFVECAEKSLGLFRAMNNELMWQLNTTDCANCYSVVWAEQKNVLAFVWENDGQKDVYVWQVGQQSPDVITQTRYMSQPMWSPDGSRFVIFDAFRNEDGYYDAGLETFSIIFPNEGTSLSTKEGIVTNDSDQYIQWIGNEVFYLWHGLGWCCSYYIFYDANTGEKLPGWGGIYGASQDMTLSPNRRWRMTDSSDYDYQSEYGYDFHYYSLFDFQTKSTFDLAEGKEIYLRFFDWSSDSSTFYLVSRPVSETAKPLPQTPFGLLALDPLTRQFTRLFDQAMDAQWSSDKQKWFVVFPVKQNDGTRGLVGGIFDPQAGTLMGREFISDHLLYANPGEGDLVPAAWSNDSTRVVFGDSQGNLTLLNLDGTTQPLASDLPTESWPTDAHYAWSPDDQRLLIQYGGQAWIATIEK